jgi:hypothetical protein
MGQEHIMSTRGLVATENPIAENVMAISNIAKRKCNFAFIWHRNRLVIKLSI